MDDDHPGARETLASIDRAVAAAEERVVRSRDLQAALERLRVTGSSRDGAATVTVTHGGVLCDLALGRSLERAPLARVRQAVLEAGAAARARSLAEVTALTSQAFGAGSATTRTVVEQYAALLAPAGPDAGPRPAATPGPASAVLR